MSKTTINTNVSKLLAKANLAKDDWGRLKY